MCTCSSLGGLRAATVTKLCVLLLGILAVLPFTAPFATLDAADFFGAGHSHSAGASVGAAHSSASAPDDDADDAAASDAVLQRVHPTALDGLVLIPTPLATGPVTSADGVIRLEAVAAPRACSSALVTALRL
jgi:hypothetical protein